MKHQSFCAQIVFQHRLVFGQAKIGSDFFGTDIEWLQTNLENFSSKREIGRFYSKSRETLHGKNSPSSSDKLRY